ncbi:MAG: hypothetical protein QM696_10825 [Steroidobacteraceae bacterium]
MSTPRAQQYLKAGHVRPSMLMLDRSFSDEEKRWILEQMVADLEAQLRATEESMNNSAKPGVAGERLRDAQRALLTLGHPQR